MILSICVSTPAGAPPPCWRADIARRAAARRTRRGAPPDARPALRGARAQAPPPRRAGSALGHVPQAAHTHTSLTRPASPCRGTCVVRQQ